MLPTSSTVAPLNTPLTQPDDGDPGLNHTGRLRLFFPLIFVVVVVVFVNVYLTPPPFNHSLPPLHEETRSS